MILFFDSGVGGLAYLEEFRRRAPGFQSVYLADTAAFPYGERDPEDVRRRVTALVQAMATRYPLRAAVIACNTASVVALDAVRQVVSFPVVGTVPAVKPAAAGTRSGHIAVLATRNTVADPYTDDLVDRFARVARVTRLGLPRLVTAAEEDLCAPDPDRISAIIREDVAGRLDPDVDTVVLACTHFVRYRNLFRQILGDGVDVVDSLDGVTRRLLYVIGAQSSPDADMITADADNAPELFFTPAGGSGDGLPPALSCRRQDLGWRPFPGRAP